jgi:hypothetical protein
MISYHPDLQRLSPLRRPDWRWRRAQTLVAARRYYCCRRDDPETGRTVRYLRALARCADGIPSAQLERNFPDLCRAHRLHDNNGTTKLTVEARLLAGQAVAEVARLTGLTPGAVAAYEALFFNVLDRLDARDWILAHALRAGPSDRTVARDRGVVLKTFAYTGGPLVLEAVLPYLVGWKDLWEPAPNLATPSGRVEQVTRLAVAAALLPRDATTDRKLRRIALMLRDRERRRPVLHAPLALRTQSLYAELQDGEGKTPFERAEATEQAVPASFGAELGRIA